MKREIVEVNYQLDMILNLIPDHTRIGVYKIVDGKKRVIYEGYRKGITKYFPLEPYHYEVINIYQSTVLQFPMIALTVKERSL